MTLLEKNIEKIPSPCYVMEEALLRRNLELIRSVAQRAGVEIILAFKAFALWKSFPIFREYISHTTASSLFEGWQWRSLAAGRTRIHLLMWRMSLRRY